MILNNYRNKEYFLNPSAYLTSGYCNLNILDSESKQNFCLPNKYLKVLLNEKGMTITQAIETYNNELDNLPNLFDFLIENDLVQFSNYRNNFENIDYEFDFPSVISNGLIDVNSEIIYLYEFINQMEEINCQYLQIRFISQIHIKDLTKIIELLYNKNIRSLQIIMPYYNELIESELAYLINNNYFLELIICYLSEVDKKSNLIVEDSQTLYFIKQNFTRKSCGIVGLYYFNSSTAAITEAKHHNSCLNRKISVDEDGNIKNCPSMSESFGNIMGTSLSDAILKPGFKKLWDLNKDKVYVCKDCEFRYICTDCRAYVEDPDDILSKPLKCGYNPYTGEWSDWIINPIKQKAIKFYNMK